MKRFLVVGLSLSLFVVCYGAEDAIPSHCHTDFVSSAIRVATLKIEEVKIPLIYSAFIVIVILAKIGETILLFLVILIMY